MSLYTVDDARVPEGLVLVHHLIGFVDAGNAVRLAARHVRDQAGPGRVLARFDIDGLLDYRGRRPAMHFDVDHWESYEDPELTVRLLEDRAGNPFLLLEGPEPDYRWEAFVRAIRELVGRWGVRLVVGLNAIPMGVPHTRPSGVIVHGTRRELVRGARTWVGRVQVPGHATALLEFRLGQAGADAMTFTVNVPHYVAATDYPEAAAVLVENLSAAAGLRLDTDPLRAAAVTTRADIDTEVAKSAEVAAVVGQLERQYDALVAESQLGDLPTADELGAELERFLAEQDTPGSG
jgi:predicted ATP-grasp superfamily ATP-dependent carboligase